ncbi:quinoprotein relay system zinc metallohydrolase 1 [Novosphingobium sp. 1949]|uniref:Quinoprotein relay system zinc metallohydrolase 1 n=1 Tax=Novosphingobium organovorum TaxID=2930092 RepID=A0ABT0BC86_9SPHN|nr:quinoprotein relay system zinc metallohydrolase 1 [Novosphingobium organovorum]MCJ2182653.1 quinoprotein relay system zinc metallohydrolase 1 [Novosphingobium organovorum]
MTLSRRTLIAGSLALPALGPLAARGETFAGTYQPKAQAIAPGVWMVRGVDAPIAFANGGAIANRAIIATDAGPVLFDPGVSLADGEAMAALALRLTGKPVARVYVSHLHPDHALGAVAFAPQIVHALPGTREDLLRDVEGFSDAMYRILADWMKGTQIAIPQGDVRAGEVTFGGRALRLLALCGHSHADLALLDTSTATLLAGDLVFHDRAPSTPHANLAAWPRALDTLAATPHRVLLPGHGPLDDKGRAIAQTRDWLRWLESALNQAADSGLTMSEAGMIAIPERFASLACARYELQRSVSHFYPALEMNVLPALKPE